MTYFALGLGLFALFSLEAVGAYLLFSRRFRLYAARRRARP